MGQIKFDEQLAVVEKYYSRLIYYELNGNRENLLGDKKSQRKCRFCGNEEQESFIKKAHAIPSSIGNNVLKTAYECDDCNSYFFLF